MYLHIGQVVELIPEAWQRGDKIQGLELTYQAPFLHHFSARFRKVSA